MFGGWGLSGRNKGILCIVASAFGFALMAFFVRLTDDYGGSISCFQKGFFRNLVALVIAAVAWGHGRMGTCVPTNACGTEEDKFHCSTFNLQPSTSTSHLQPALILLARCLFGTFGIFANFYAISHIHVGEAMALNKTAPFFTVLCSWLFMRERVTRRQLVCLALAFAGAMLVVKPGLRADDLNAALLGLSSGVGAGFAYACVHKLGKMKVSGPFIVLVFSAFSCLASVPFMVAEFRPMTFAQTLILLGAGAGAALGQFGITAAYRFAEPRTIAAFDYTGVVFSALFGLVFFAQVPDILSVVGFVAILVSAVRLAR